MLTKVILKAITNENYLETEYTDCKKGLEILFPRYCTTCQEMFVKTFSYCENRLVRQVADSPHTQQSKLSSKPDSLDLPLRQTKRTLICIDNTFFDFGTNFLIFYRACLIFFVLFFFYSIMVADNLTYIYCLKTLTKHTFFLSKTFQC